MSVAAMKNGNTKVADSMNTTRVSDLGLASYLTALDFELVALEGQGGRKEFLFRDVPRETVVTYYGGKGLVDARKLLGAFRDLKGLVGQVF
jgi:hypothetical protein